MGALSPRGFFPSRGTTPLSALYSEPLFLKLRWKCTLLWGAWKDSRLLGDRWAPGGFILWPRHLPSFFFLLGAKRGERGFVLLSSLLSGGGNLVWITGHLFRVSILSTVWKTLVFFFSGTEPSLKPLLR